MWSWLTPGLLAPDWCIWVQKLTGLCTRSTVNLLPDYTGCRDIMLHIGCRTSVAGGLLLQPDYTGCRDVRVYRVNGLGGLYQNLHSSVVSQFLTSRLILQLLYLMALCAPGYRGSLAKFAQFSCKLASDFVVISEATIFNGTIVLPVTGVLWKRPPRKCLKNCF